MITSQLRSHAAPELRVRPGETVAVIGKPGTGKSTLAGWLARDAKSAIVYETKGDERERRGWERAGFTRCETPGELDEHARAMLVVPPAWLLERRRWAEPDNPWSRALEHPFRRVPTLLLFDEALNVFPAGGGHPGTHRLLHQGRSAGHVPIICSQMANDIDTRLLRLAQHVVVMGPAQHADDLAYLQRATGAPTRALRSLGYLHLGWWRQGEQDWQLFEPLDLAGPRALRAARPARIDPDAYRPWYRRSRPRTAAPPLTVVTVL